MASEIYLPMIISSTDIFFIYLAIWGKNGIEGSLPPPTSLVLRSHSSAPSGVENNIKFSDKGPPVVLHLSPTCNEHTCLEDHHISACGDG